MKQPDIFGNGDIFSADDAVRRIRETGVDGIMVGRGALDGGEGVVEGLPGRAHVEGDGAEGLVEGLGGKPVARGGRADEDGVDVGVGPTSLSPSTWYT